MQPACRPTLCVRLCAREIFKYHREFFTLFVKEQRAQWQTCTHNVDWLHAFVVPWNKKSEKRDFRWRSDVAAQCMHNVETWGSDAPRAGIFAERGIHSSSFAKNHHKTSRRAPLTPAVPPLRFNIILIRWEFFSLPLSIFKGFIIVIIKRRRTSLVLCAIK